MIDFYIKGDPILKTMEKLGSSSGLSQKEILIEACGQYMA
jgi:hypothetical protein